MTTNKDTKKSKARDFSNLTDSSDQERFGFEKMVLNSDFVELVKEEMEKRSSMTQGELGELLEVSKPYISKLFSGQKFFNVEMLAKIQRIFNKRIRIVTADFIKKEVALAKETVIEKYELKIERLQDAQIKENESSLQNVFISIDSTTLFPTFYEDFEPQLKVRSQITMPAIAVKTLGQKMPVVFGDSLSLIVQNYHND